MTIMFILLFLCFETQGGALTFRADAAFFHSGVSDLQWPHLLRTRRNATKKVWANDSAPHQQRIPRRIELDEPQVGALRHQRIKVARCQHDHVVV